MVHTNQSAAQKEWFDQGVYGKAYKTAMKVRYRQPYQFAGVNPSARDWGQQAANQGFYALNKAFAEKQKYRNFVYKKDRPRFEWGSYANWCQLHYPWNSPTFAFKGPGQWKSYIAQAYNGQLGKFGRNHMEQVYNTFPKMRPT